MAEYAYGEAGELLFRYTRAATAFEHILPEKKIRLNPYRLCALEPESLPSEPLKDLLPASFRAAVDDYHDKNADLLLFTQLQDWSGDQEFRFVTF